MNPKEQASQLRLTADILETEHPPTKAKRGQPKGNAAPIGSGPAGETCGTCAHAYCVEYAKRYHKCRLVKATGGPGTDIRLKWAACSRFEKRKEKP